MDFPTADIDRMLEGIERGLRLGHASVIFVDSSIPTYLVGAPHPHKTDARRWLEELVTGRERLVTDAEVLQEILHRYVSIERPDAIQRRLMRCWESSMKYSRWTGRQSSEPRGIVLGRKGLSARDAIHLAIMQIHGIKRILSLDRGFDGFPGIARLS